MPLDCGCRHGPTIHPRLTMRQTFMIAIIPLGLAGCAGTSLPIVEKGPALGEMAPIAQPSWQAGMTAYQIDKMTGERISWSVLEVAGGMVTSKHSDGCSWTVSATWVAPPLRWENCGENPDWTAGTRTITAAEGTLWPLRVGNRAVYRADLESHTGKRSSEVRTCTVEEPVRISVGAGETDAMKVVCVSVYDKDTRSIGTWYWTEDRGEALFTRVHSKRGLEALHETIAIEVPGTS
ncbi:MAG: hypothetical protein R3F54_30345 [Alphaproteobacteria bacterium]